MTNDDRRAQIQLAIKKIEGLRASLTKAADSCSSDMENAVRSGEQLSATLALGRRVGLLQADEQIAAYQKWFLSQFEADLCQ
jgi:hypothetical protein